ncbi:helix-turn-helix domain-containing protein [Butyrivibrio sp. AE3004]|uniref:helix-turn-helix domain-containing protein n=1 Tax=Butyrivibrio sp. AE3004 TaxID=1506994 RepID=UPI0021012C45|nr:helix-turn-helix transcriptional regulator [Butyrivibrio sp. AE3004]
MPDRKVGERLRVLRMSEGLTQEAVAKLFNLSSGRIISAYETGTRLVPLDLVVKYSGEFDISTDWILTGRDSTSCKNTA